MKIIKSVREKPLALGLVLVFATGLSLNTVEAAPPVAPYVTNINNLTMEGVYTLTGTADPGTIVRVEGVDATSIATTTFGGVWTATIDVEDEDVDEFRITSVNSLDERSETTVFLLGQMINQIDEDGEEDDGDDEATARVIAGMVFT